MDLFYCIESESESESQCIYILFDQWKYKCKCISLLTKFFSKMTATSGRRAVEYISESTIPLKWVMSLIFFVKIFFTKSKLKHKLTLVIEF